MNKNLSRVFLCTLAFGSLAVSVSALAQSGKNSSVELNFEALEELEGYRPPTMFGGNQRPSLSPQPDQRSPSSYAPKPARKPEQVMLVLDGTPALKVKRENLPPPGLAMDSKTYIEEIHQNFLDDRMPPESLNQAKKTAAPPIPALSNEDLVAPNAQDVLHQIDPVSSETRETKASEVEAPPPPSESNNMGSPGEAGIIQSSQDKISLGYKAGASALTSDIQTLLRDHFVKKMQDKMQSRIEIRAYASSEDQGESHARRVSLARALAIRSFLIDEGIQPKRIDIRPLGTSNQSGVVDRADIIITDG